MGSGVSATTAARWVERWECQQQRYAVDREERCTVIADVVEHAGRGRSGQVVVDLGSGPGALAARLAARLPGARVLAVDADPLLLELGRAYYGDGDRLRFVRALIGAPGWREALGLDRQVDAVVSTTALHYLGRDALGGVYRDLAGLLRPGGVFVNGDHIGPDAPRIRDLALDVARRHADRSLDALHEDWESWWSGAAEDPELAPFLSCPDTPGHPPCEDPDLPVSGHAALLHEAGFAQVGTVWQHGTSRVLVAVR
ncbi:trans-aconitate 2-methyltransferase [Streptomyces sp. WAC06614]|uniref:class I SAM-dependent methyltransferase n=1 Tax=Streptomyces sp. WAC06614 TaxID=2487416 RepID=UPI000F77346B|nr:class I SAM-dependent methyltransferase [Streptomyces sp. WAC06614]RSS81670.1 class I SAM-dependent methyltransferase [Streptomyces sp. WAC06614]